MSRKRSAGVSHEEAVKLVYGAASKTAELTKQRAIEIVRSIKGRYFTVTMDDVAAILEREL